MLGCSEGKAKQVVLLVKPAFLLNRTFEISPGRVRTGHGKPGKHEINPFALENFAEKCVLKLVEPFSSHCLAVWQHKTWRSQWLEQDNEISLYTERVHQQRCLLC